MPYSLSHCFRHIFSHVTSGLYIYRCTVCYWEDCTIMVQERYQQCTRIKIKIIKKWTGSIGLSKMLLQQTWKGWSSMLKITALFFPFSFSMIQRTKIRNNIVCMEIQFCVLQPIPNMVELYKCGPWGLALPPRASLTGLVLWIDPWSRARVRLEPRF